MEILDLELLPLAIALLVPGFVAVKVYDLLVPGERRDWSASVLEVLAYGTLNFSLWFWALDWLLSVAPTRAWLFRIGTAGILFISPVLLAIAVTSLLRWPAVRRWVRHPTPTGWDHFFGKAKPCWVILHLKTGELIGGLYGSESLASCYPNPQDIYLEEAWHLDRVGRFVERVPQTVGVYVRADDCKAIQFFKVGRSPVDSRP